MRELTIGKNDAGQRLDRFLGKAMPLLPPALLQKYIRIKRVKCNGARCQRDQRLREGDVLTLYINDEFFDQPREDNLFLTLFQPKLEVLYEDEHLLLAGGLALVAAVKSLLKAPLLALYAGVPIAHSVRYFLVVLTAGCLWPMTFRVFARYATKNSLPRR